MACLEDVLVARRRIMQVVRFSSLRDECARSIIDESMTAHSERAG